MKKAERVALYGSGKEYWRRLWADMIRDRWLILLLIPGLIYFIVFKYLPMWGIIISFENYVPYLGPFKSEWVGLKWFNYFFSNKAWTRYLTNTLILSLMNIVFFFPAPIILALLLNEMRNQKYKKLVQTFLYVPHFISIVIVVSITLVMFSSTGIVYKLVEQLTGHPVKFMTDPNLFRPMIIGQTIWKETGWGTIIFLAALTNVDTQLYEAAMVDGAGRLRRLWHITLPAIKSTIVLMLILRMGSVLDTGYDHLILMANSLNRKASQTLDVFVYQQGLQQAQYSYASAIGLMKSVVSVTLVVSANKVSHLLGEQGLY
ncbi:MAG: ABC transporter permease subunit [Clostridia bacterium]|nr:ABC transporter permease subunit [Clostridia bacterium]